MTVVFPDPTSTAIFRYGFYEEELTAVLLAWLEPGMTFIDVGSHFGYFALLASSLVGESGQVHAFEPTPSSFQVLKANTKQRPNVSTANCALWSERAVLPFNDFGIPFSAFNSFYAPRLDMADANKPQRTVYVVEAVSLDEYVFQRGLAPGFVKVDAESAEYQIVQGMERTMNQFHPVISVEVGDMNVEGAVNSKTLLRRLMQAGYEPFDWKEGRLAKHKLRDRYDYGNVFLLPE